MLEDLTLPIIDDVDLDDLLIEIDLDDLLTDIDVDLDDLMLRL